MDIDYIALGKKIRQERIKKNLTIEELAEILGLSPSYMGLIERGQRGISIETLCKLSNVFKVSTDYLLFSMMNDANNVDDSSSTYYQNQIIALTNQYSEHDFDFLIEFIRIKNKYRVQKH